MQSYVCVYGRLTVCLSVSLSRKYWEKNIQGKNERRLYNNDKGNEKLIFTTNNNSKNNSNSNEKNGDVINKNDRRLLRI